MEPEPGPRNWHIESILISLNSSDLRSPLTESNRRPSPYHGDALPTELRGRVAWRWSARPTRRAPRQKLHPPTGSLVPGEHTRPEIATCPGGRRLTGRVA